MIRPAALLSLLPAALGAQQPEVIVYRSDVALVRVDAQVLDRDRHPVTGLRREDFLLRESGREREIRNFAREEMPVDVLFLLDVSGSMRTHVERLAAASRQALEALGPDDRVAIMVFDRSTRVRLPFRNRREGADREFAALLRQEGFNGGTDIPRALVEAAEYIGRAARRDARRAIVILTDDQTERGRGRETAEILPALETADCILSALLAPDAMRNRSSSSPRVGIGLPLPFPGGSRGGVVWGRRYPGPGAGPGSSSRTEPAGTARIAWESGGDSASVDDAGALETTLSRLRQRYALYFLLPPGVRAGEQRPLELALQAEARRRFPQAEIRYRPSYRAAYSAAAESPETTVVGNPAASRPEAAQDTTVRRRRAVDESTGPRGPNPALGASAPAQPAAPAPAAARPATPQRGWRRADEPEPPPPPPAKPKRN